MSKKKIAVLLPSFSIGGTENMVAHLAKYIDKDKFDMLVVSLAAPMDTHVQSLLEDSGVQIAYALKGKVKIWKVFFNVNSELQAFRPDLIHSNMYVFAFCVPYLLTHHIKLLHTIHNKPVNEFKDKYKKMIAWLYQINKAVPVAISHIVEKEMKELYSKELKRIERVYNPVEISKFYTERKYSEKKNITFINVARFMKQKNQTLLLEAFAEAKNQAPDINLVFVGDGELRSELEKKIEILGIRENVFLAGNVHNVNEYLAKADIFVLSSDYEGLPLSILEAMAAGLPIISTNVGGVADIVTDNGILIPPKDGHRLANEMVKLVLNHKLRYEMGCNSARNAKQYDSSEFIAQYESLYMKYAK